MSCITLKLLLEDKEIFKEFKKEFGRKATVKEVVDWLHTIDKRRWEQRLMTRKPKITISMINNGANISISHEYLLMWAAGKGSLDLVKLLVKKGFNIHYPHNYPLRCAALKGHLKVVKFLVEKGAKIYAGNDSSLSFAAMNGHLRVVKFLVEKGADIRAYNYDALLRSAMNGHFKVVKFLRKHIR